MRTCIQVSMVLFLMEIMVFQVEFHPLLYQRELLDYCERNHIWLQAYTSLGKGKVFHLPAYSKRRAQYLFSNKLDSSKIPKNLYM